MNICKDCNHDVRYHHRDCPSFPKNTDIYQYQHSQMEELEQEFYDNIDGNINNIEGFLYHEECGDR